MVISEWIVLSVVLSNYNHAESVKGECFNGLNCKDVGITLM